MKIITVMALIMLLASCAIINPGSVPIPEDELFQTRKFVGIFQEYKHTIPDRVGDPHLIWIKTTSEPTFGIMSAYSKECNFEQGEWLFIRRIYYSPGGVSGYWIYQIEGDTSGKSYRLSKFQYEQKVLIQVWF